FTYPSTYECMSPNDFLLTEPVVTRVLWFLMPSRRPMDNMKAGWNRPQEDEFALCLLGARSPYLTIAFPNNLPRDEEYLDLEGLSPANLRRWKRVFKGFLKTLSFKSTLGAAPLAGGSGAGGPKRLVLKSPPHSCRIKVLQQMFPGAIFIHIVRD